MRSPAVKLVLALAAAAILTSGSLTAVASAQLAFAPCTGTNDFACAHLTVPLDPSGVTAGAITLAIRRHLAPVGGAKSAVIALAGGPGQAAIPFAEDFAELLGPILSSRDLIIYDQRGTGLSHPLSCHGFEHPRSYDSFGALIAACAEQIGAERAFYTTPDSVADIEAIRQADGYEKLVLYGTSYGTKLALEYAQEHPEHVEALILDSVVTPAGPEPLDRPTLAAVPRILRQLCAYGACAKITPNPVADLTRLVQRMQRSPVTGRVISDRGHAILRAEFIAAVRSAAGGDSAALARLIARAESGGEDEPSEGIDAPLYYATTCEEQDFPWSRTASPHARLAQVVAQLATLPASALAPFTAANALALSDVAACAFWPFATPAPPVIMAPLPNVPTLILSGADDLRTPTSGARAVAAQIPDAHLLVVPNTGHSVLTTEPTRCAREALLAQFAGKSITPCRAGPPSPLLRPTPLPPERLSAVVPTHDYHGRTGRTLQAVKLTLSDLARQLLLALLEKGDTGRTPDLSSVSSGGLRAGWTEDTADGLHFHDYTYIPGVSLSGVVKRESVTLRIGGGTAAHGTLRLGSHHQLIGILGGRHVVLAAGGGSGTGASIASARAAQRASSAQPTTPSWLPAALDELRTRLDRLPLGLGEYLSALPALWTVRLGTGL
jgi:pimeloyl-ACP methyl ester carboxylesterase